MYLNYRSISDLNQCIIRSLDKFPHDIDLIVGIPRSGMLTAYLLALYLNKPFTDIDSLIEGRICGSGDRSVYIDKSKSNKILVVDDTIRFGSAIKKAKAKLGDFIKHNPQITLKYGVVYATTQAKGFVDYYCEIIDGDRIFQWNIFHCSKISNSILDIDGVLCPNPPIDDDGPKYINYISNAPTLYAPSVKIDKIVSCRLEKYRSITEKWLANNNIKYNQLIMLDFMTKEQRIAWGMHGQFKGEIYKKSKDTLFIESSLQEAKQIFDISKKPVFCTENFEMLNDNSIYNRSLTSLHLKISKSCIGGVWRKLHEFINRLGSKNK